MRFDLAFARFRKTVLRQIGPASVLTVPLSTDGDERRDISPEVEVAAADFLGGDPQKIDDPVSGSSWTLRLMRYQTIKAVPA